MVVSTALVPFGWTDVVTYALSVLAIVITGIVLIQGYRDTAALHAKLDEVIIALRETRNDVVGLEHEAPDKIAKVVKNWRQRLTQLSRLRVGGAETIAAQTPRAAPSLLKMHAAQQSVPLYEVRARPHRTARSFREAFAIPSAFSCPLW